MEKQKSIVEMVIYGIAILLCGFSAFLGLSEYYKVAISKQTKFYPFGTEGPVPYYYKTPELYSNVNLVYGIAFVTLFGIGIWNLKSKKLSGFTIFGLTILLILIQLFHGWASY